MQVDTSSVKINKQNISIVDSCPHRRHALAGIEHESKRLEIAHHNYQVLREKKFTNGHLADQSGVFLALYHKPLLKWLEAYKEWNHIKSMLMMTKVVSKIALTDHASSGIDPSTCEDLHDFHFSLHRKPLIRNKEGCASCGVTAEVRKLYKCTGCKTVWYCGKKCQVTHWKNSHKANCSQVLVLPEVSSVMTSEGKKLLETSIMPSEGIGSFEEYCRLVLGKPLPPRIPLTI